MKKDNKIYRIRCNQSIGIIEDNDLCISCGACVHVCPFENISMKYNKYRGKWDAVVQNREKCSDCDGAKLCLYVCPSYSVDYIDLASSNENDGLGRIRAVYNGFSKSDSIRSKSSSGGFIYELATNLLSKKEIDGVIMLGHVSDMEYTPTLYKWLDGEKSFPNSIYHNINFEKAVSLIKDNDGRFMIVALPCQLTSIELLLERNRFRQLRNRIALKVALICGYSFDRTNMECFAALNKDTLINITYREKDRYRITRLKGKKFSKTFYVRKPKSLLEYLNNNLMFDKALVQTNCMYCVDHLGYCADIVVGDAWQSRYKSDHVGTNLLIARTDQGLNAVKAVTSFHYEEGYKSELIESQGKEYALASKVHSAKMFKLKDIYYLPEHKFSEKASVVDSEKHRWRDRMTFIYLKPLIRRGRYQIARLLYAVLHLDKLLNSCLRRINKGTW